MGGELLEQCNTRYEQLEGRGYFDWCMLDANERLGGQFRYGVIMIIIAEARKRQCIVALWI